MEYSATAAYQQTCLEGWESAFDVDISGSAFRQLLSAAITANSLTSFIVRRSGIQSTQHADSFRCLYECTTKQWPGTQKSSEPVDFHICKTDDLPEYITTATGILQCCKPGLPEDLSFYTSKGKLWMYTVAHEDFLYFHPQTMPVHVKQIVFDRLAAQPDYVSVEQLRDTLNDALKKGLAILDEWCDKSS